MVSISSHTLVVFSKSSFIWVGEDSIVKPNGNFRLKGILCSCSLCSLVPKDGRNRNGQTTYQVQKEIPILCLKEVLPCLVA